MELRHLRYYVAVAKAGSFVKAAAALNLAQPALSRQVQDLERELGVSLFVRLPHGVSLSRAGQRFLPDAQRILDGADRAAARLQPHREGHKRRLYVGYGELLAYWPHIAEMFGGFRLAHPDVPVHAMEMSRAEIRSGLREDRIDIAIIGVASWPIRGFDGVRLFAIPHTGVLLPANHPLAARAHLRIADLAPLRWYHLRADATWDVYESFRAALRDRGFDGRHTVVRPPGYAFLPQIAAGQGWSLADATLGKAVTMHTSGIVYRPFKDVVIQVWAGALWKKGNHSERVAGLIDAARRAWGGVGAEQAVPDAIRQAGVVS